MTRYMKLVVAVATAVVCLPSSAPAAPPPAKLPAPTYKSVSKEVLIPMDDGVRIAATVAWPSEDGQTRARPVRRPASRPPGSS